MGARTPVEARGRKKHTQEHQKIEERSTKLKQISLANMQAWITLVCFSNARNERTFSWVNWCVNGVGLGSIYSPKPSKSHWKNLPRSSLHGHTELGPVAQSLGSWLFLPSGAGIGPVYHTTGPHAMSASFCATRWTLVVWCTPDWASVLELLLYSAALSRKLVRCT
jgi:hypothetical protein